MLARFTAFFRGVFEFRRSFTWADPARIGGEYTRLDQAYDYGREIAHRVTLRRFED